MKATDLGQDDRIQRAAARIGDLIGGTSLQLALAIGCIVVEEIYGSDLSLWSRRGPKDTSLRQLAADPRLTISASALYRAIGIYELRLRLPDHPMWDLLTACHLRAVLGLPAPEQSRLLDLATQHCWTIHAMEQAAGVSRDSHKASRGGRPRKHCVVRAIEYAERALLFEDTTLGAPDTLREMPPHQRIELSRRLSLIRQRCEQLASALSYHDGLTGRRADRL